MRRRRWGSAGMRDAEAPLRARLAVETDPAVKRQIAAALTAVTTREARPADASVQLGEVSLDEKVERTEKGQPLLGVAELVEHDADGSLAVEACPARRAGSVRS